MAGLVPAIHVLVSLNQSPWMPGTSPGMTELWHDQVRPPHLNSGVPGTNASNAAQNWER